ncbi:MAG: SIMPL domain-containing protein [Holosporaceae bacterium]|jgi:hypothetical protein|nr:SIMPL domain-containing protein [Holosporaceae bacterium]
MKYSCIIGSAVIACGLVGFGYNASKNMKSGSELVEVKGLAEKLVRADIGEIHITVLNKDEKVEDLYKKRSADKDKIIGFLKSRGITDEEIVSCNMHTRECQEDVSMTKSRAVNTTVNVILPSPKTVLFRAEDKFCVRTKDLSKIQKIREDIIKLSAEGMLIESDCSYKLTNFSGIKMEMMGEASENARKNAEAFIAPHRQKIDKVVYLRQGEISIRGEDESEEINSYWSQEKNSINKRLRLVIRAGFTKKPK